MSPTSCRCSTPRPRILAANGYLVNGATVTRHYASRVVLLPGAFAAAILALLVILRRERHQRLSGIAAPRPLYVYMALGFFAFVGLFMLVGVLTT
jgi:hypothetical protein